MKDDGGLLWSLAAQFAVLSLFAIGGANAAVPEMHRLAVEIQQWMTDRQFADLFAIAQLAPGPNVILVTLIGYQAAGLAGAAVATAAMCGPTCVLAYGVGRIWERFREARWRRAIQAGLVPVSIGLVAASALILAQATGHSAAAFALTAATAAVAYFTRVNPLWLLASAGLVGLSGYV
ncbi:MAG: chromate transporter [Pseudorhodoplanes sp.]|nr:chromate transporter [Pseudorhodoplanes sp.]MCL4712202.1 chromate transporter [Pseudorhodoplanes sp.]MCQ3941647.1 chromate transporter [Alphaproteobacteria bacterium]GIK79474.1 MAG: chromate transporter [Alphaproteobacteria bacterium]